MVIGYLKTLHGCANTLRKLSRPQESLQKYLQIMQVISDTHRVQHSQLPLSTSSCCPPVLAAGIINNIHQVETRWPMSSGYPQWRCHVSEVFLQLGDLKSCQTYMFKDRGASLLSRAL